MLNVLKQWTRQWASPIHEDELCRCQSWRTWCWRWGNLSPCVPSCKFVVSPHLSPCDPIHYFLHHSSGFLHSLQKFGDLQSSSRGISPVLRKCFLMYQHFVSHGETSYGTSETLLKGYSPSACMALNRLVVPLVSDSGAVTGFTVCEKCFENWCKLLNFPSLHGLIPFGTYLWNDTLHTTLSWQWSVCASLWEHI